MTVSSFEHFRAWTGLMFVSSARELVPKYFQHQTGTHSCRVLMRGFQVLHVHLVCALGGGSLL